MPRVSDINLIQQREQHTLTIRMTTSVEHLPQLIGEAYGKIGAYLDGVRLLPSGIPFVCYHNFDMANLDVEIGFPVEAPLAGQGEIQGSSLPAGRIVTAIYRGPYSGMNEVYGELSTWMKDHDLQPVGPVYEEYFNGPEFPPEELLTQIVFPVL